MSARTAPVLTIFLLTALLTGGCGQAESTREPSRGSSALNGSIGSLDHRPSPARDQQAAAPAGEGKARTDAVPRPSPRTAQAPSAEHRHALRVIEKIISKTPPAGKAADGKGRGSDAIEKILAQARKEGVQVVEPSGGSSSGEGIAQILRQLGSDNP